jgi:hypothetical protein
LNSVPRIGRRSFSPISKFRGEGFRFFGGDFPRGFGSGGAAARSWRGQPARDTGGESRGRDDGDKSAQTKETVRDKRVDAESFPSLPRIFNLGDDDYWNEILNGARQNVLDKLVRLRSNFFLAIALAFALWLSKA